MKKHWPWWRTLLWAYSLLYIILLFILFLVVGLNPVSGHTQAASSESAGGFILAGLFVPVLVFLILTGIESL